MKVVNTGSPSTVVNQSAGFRFGVFRLSLMSIVRKPPLPQTRAWRPSRPTSIGLTAKPSFTPKLVHHCSGLVVIPGPVPDALTAFADRPPKIAPMMAMAIRTSGLDQSAGATNREQPDGYDRRRFLGDCGGAEAISLPHGAPAADRRVETYGLQTCAWPRRQPVRQPPNSTFAVLLSTPWDFWPRR